ncbi:MAG: TonB-dependent receptor [Gemmatimonadota bacterium]|nr:TonB-dependent receptor [Gemmatimonadota bacterium]
MRYLVRLWLLLLISPAGLVAQAQPGSGGEITGQAVDADTGMPVSGASVSVESGGRVLGSTITDPTGRYVVADLPAGEEVRVVFELLGYGRTSEAVVVRADAATSLDVVLEPRAISLAPLRILADASAASEGMPGTATHISAPAVDLLQPIGTQELLQYVPGVHGFADDGMGNSRLSIGIRGLNPRRSSRVLILEDGIPIQPAPYMYPNMYYNPPAERIDRVEVLKGSGAIRYGPQTMGGVVNYLTSRPGGSDRAVASLTAGNNGYASLMADLPLGGSRTFRPELQLLYKRGDGFRQNNAFEQANGTFKAQLLRSDDRVAYLKANVNYENSNATYTGLTEYSFRSNPRFNPKEHDNFRVFRSSLDLIMNEQESSRLQHDTRLYLSFFDRRWWREDDVFVRASDYQEGEIRPVPPYQPGDLVRVGGGRQNLGILRTFYVGGIERSYEVGHTLFGGEATLDFGARVHFERFIDDKKRGDAPDAREGIYYTGDPEEPETVDIVGQSHHYETTALALHASEQVRFGNLSVRPGVRFELFEQQQVDRLSGSLYQDRTTVVLLPGLGVNYRLGDHELFGGVHRGFTPPSSGTLRVVNFGDDVPEGGLDLDAEKSWNAELGVRSNLPWLSLEASGFHVTVENLVAAGRGTAFKNLGRVRNRGAELGATLAASELSPVLPDLNVSYTYLDTEVLKGVVSSAVRAGGAEVDIAGNELTYAPRHTVTAGLSRTFPWGLSLRTDVQYVDEVFTDFENVTETYNRGDTGPVPAYHIFNTAARYAVNDRVTLSVTAKNLLDAVYIGSRLHSNPGQPQANLSSGILPGPRRQINVGLDIAF